MRKLNSHIIYKIMQIIQYSQIIIIKNLQTIFIIYNYYIYKLTYI